ncbi:MAG TPA: hypothetical protein VF749_12240 [Candidatus Acidoferrum sp.]
MKSTKKIEWFPRGKKTSRLCSCVALGGLLLAPAIYAQTDEQKGIEQGNYNIKQAVEFGGRFTAVTGDSQTYDTLVNLQQGPRLLDFATEMRSLNHRGTFFDRFFFSNFGYGGDPNVVSVLRITKNKWYSFDALFRHDENFWDYSLLANPFNPAPPPANAPPGFNPVLNAPATVSNTQIVALSPRDFNTRRNMQNYGFTVLPDAKVRLRVGYYHSTNVGPAFTPIHEGTEQFLFQNLWSGITQYRLGVDFRFLPRTNISYDHIWSYYKTDPGSTDENQQFSVGSRFPLVDLGVSWNGPPCNPAFQPGGIVSPPCNAFYNYFSHWRGRTNAPTEQINVQSSALPAVQFSGKFSYTGSDMHVYDYTQSFAGFVSRSLLSNFSLTGPIEGRQVSSYGDFGVTWQITHDFSLEDEVHYGSWQEPAHFVGTNCSFFSTNLTTTPIFFNSTATLPATCVPPANAVAGIPLSSSKSGADILVNLDSNFLKQQRTSNLVEGQIYLSTNAGAYFGYRYSHREIADNFFNLQNAIYFPPTAQRGNCALANAVLPAGCTRNADGSVSFQTPNPVFGPPGVTDITTNAAVLGLWLKPVPRVSINLDADLGSANNTFTPLGPQNYQEFRARIQYRTAGWLNFSGYFQTMDGQNPASDIDQSQHNRSTGISASFTPSDKFSAQLGYNYDDIYSRLLVCFTSDFAEPGLPACPGVSGLVQQVSPYSSRVNTGFVYLLWTPVKRLSTGIGANLSGVTGNQLNLNPLSPVALAPTGALNSNWYQPYGAVSYRFSEQWTGRARWDYYGYHEDQNGSYQDLFAPRNFHGNLITLSLRFAF